MNKMLDVVLTSIVNNDYILNKVIEDINERFKIDVDRTKLVNYLSTVETKNDTSNTYAW